MRQIKIAQQGWNHAHPAGRLADLDTGIRVPWVELNLDGQSIRIPGGWLTSVDVHSSGDEFTTVKLGLIGAPEYVYLDADGGALR